jgi:mono/diheme cytochrome c family protein
MTMMSALSAPSSSRVLAICAALFYVGLGCSSKEGEATADAAPSCPNDLPDACPADVPSYKDDIAHIFDVHCNSCHGPGGTAASKDFTTYANVYRQRSAILDQTYNCHMPPPEERPLTDEQRQKLLAWFVCKAPNN